jgi:hypothetical protein
MTSGDRGFYRLIWLMPVAYAAHLAEEAPNFVRWTQSLGGELTQTEFLVLNGLFFPVFTAICVNAATRRTAGAVFLAAMIGGTVLFWNALFHIGATALTGQYSPGTVTAALIYWPLALTLGWQALRSGALAPKRLALAAGLGLAIMTLVAWGGVFRFQT